MQGSKLKPAQTSSSSGGQSKKKSGEIFDAAGLINVPKFTRNKVLREMENISPIKKPPMIAKHREKRLQ